MPIPTNEEVGVNGLPLGTQTVTEIFDAAESGEEEGNWVLWNTIIYFKLTFLILLQIFIYITS